MISQKNDRGFIHIKHETYPEHQTSSLIAESSKIGDYEDSFECPGSSYLWIGDNYHLNREEVLSLAECLLYWLDHKRLPEEID